MPDKPKKKRLSASDNNKERIVRLLEQCVKENKGRKARILSNRAHYYNDGLDGESVGVNPVLGSQFAPEIKEAAQRSQTVLILKHVIEMKARMTENHYEPVVTSPDAKGNTKADQFEEMLSGWARLMERRLPAGHQDAMSDAQLVDSDGVLHLRRMKDTFPEIPEYEYSDEEKDGFEKNPVSGEKKFREKEARRLDRMKAARARAGCPYQIDVVDRANFYGVRDKLGGYAFGAIIENQGFWQYSDSLRADDNLTIMVEQGERMKKLRVYGPEERFEGEAPRNVTRVHLMTRDSWYELVATDEVQLEADNWIVDDWELVKSADHAWDQATFFPVPALTFNGGKGWRKDMPALEALFRLKPGYDRRLAITNALAETFATNEIVYERGPQGEDQTDARGNVQSSEMSGDGVAVLPRDWRARQIGVDINNGWMTMLADEADRLAEATPPTGVAETSASSQPWTVQLNQAQAAVLPKNLMKKQNIALEMAYVAMARDMSLGEENGGLADEFWSYKVDGDGVVNPRQLIGIKAEDIETLQIGVDINATTAAEQITLTEHGLGLFERGAIHERDFQENFRHQANAAEYLLEKDAEQAFAPIKGSLIQLKLAEQYGKEIVVGANLDLFSADTANGGIVPVDIDKALGESGIQPLSPTMGDLEPQTPEGAIPQPAVVG